jgi:hypothetical protein
MEPLQILEALDHDPPLPVAAIEAARAAREAVVPLMLRELESYIVTGQTQLGRTALFVAIHLLAEWRETRAYRPLARLLTLPAEAVDWELIAALPETIHRVMAALYDGDPAPLHAIIHAVDASPLIRPAIFDTLVMLTRSGAIPRAQTAAFLRDCDTRLPRDDDGDVWSGWAQAIAWLGLVGLKPLVDQAYARGTMDSGWFDLKVFEEDLAHALAHPDAPPRGAGDSLAPFGDTITELSDWEGFPSESEPAEGDLLDEDGHEPSWAQSGIPAHNPYRHVGRNDPCPCGSGSKYKKCCLAKHEAESFRQSPR